MAASTRSHTDGVEDKASQRDNSTQGCHPGFGKKPRRRAGGEARIEIDHTPPLLCAVCVCGTRLVSVRDGFSCVVLV